MLDYVDVHTHGSWSCVQTPSQIISDASQNTDWAKRHLLPYELNKGIYFYH